MKPDQVGECSITSAENEANENALSSTTTPSNYRYKIHSDLPGKTHEIKNTENIQTSPQAALVSNIDTNQQSDYFENQNSFPDNTSLGYSYQGTNDSAQYSGYQTNSENTGYPEPNYVSLHLLLHQNNFFKQQMTCL